MKKKEPKFKLDDLVISILTGDYFYINGVVVDSDGSVFYQGDDKIAEIEEKYLEIYKGGLWKD